MVTNIREVGGKGACDNINLNKQYLFGPILLLLMELSGIIGKVTTILWNTQRWNLGMISDEAVQPGPKN